METVTIALPVRRVAALAEDAAAVVGGIVLYDLHPTRAGDALRGVGFLRPHAQSNLYVLLGVVGLTVAVGAAVVGSSPRLTSPLAWRAVRAGVALALIAVVALAVDTKDGLVATTHLLVYVVTLATVLRSIRLLRHLQASAA
jgi:hypothetical protein